MRFAAICLLFFGLAVYVVSALPQCPNIECAQGQEAGCFTRDEVCVCSCGLKGGSCHHVILNFQHKCKSNEILECFKESTTCKCQCVPD
ncbi:hypothetical protein MRX96_011067 [Rhipicephalus microplus]